MKNLYHITIMGGEGIRPVHEGTNKKKAMKLYRFVLEDYKEMEKIDSVIITVWMNDAPMTYTRVSDVDMNRNFTQKNRKK